jgi:sirohydrochlorin cobaltochelatase
MSAALVLAGHGSHISPETAGIVWKHVDLLRVMGAADEVTAAFWKETPSFHTVFNSLTSDDITIVPLFTAQGYFTQTVIPAEMGVTSAITHRDGKTIRYARTLEHPYLTQIVRQRVEAALRALNAPPEHAAVVIIGHSTRRNPESRRATEAQAAAIRSAGLVAEVQAVYLDDSPEIPEAYTLTSAPNLIAVPYFLALGSHTTIDVPAELSLPPGQTTGQINGRTVFYAPPVGTDEALLDVILELAREVNSHESFEWVGGSVGAQHAAPLHANDSVHDVSAGKPANVGATHESPLQPPPSQIDTNLTPARGAHPLHSKEWGSGSEVWQCFPTAGRERFIETALARGELRFGQLRVTPAVVHVWGDAYPDERLESSAALRARIRENPFRPLATSTDLPGGWRIEIQSPDTIHAVVETVYPGVVADWAAQQQGKFTFQSLEATAARQIGMYRPLDQLSKGQREALVNNVCGKCVRHATWFHGDTPQDAIPCPEPCNLWLSRALEARE